MPRTAYLAEPPKTTTQTHQPAQPIYRLKHHRKSPAHEETTMANNGYDVVVDVDDDGDLGHTDLTPDLEFHQSSCSPQICDCAPRKLADSSSDYNQDQATGNIPKNSSSIAALPVPRLGMSLQITVLILCSCRSQLLFRWRRWSLELALWRARP